MRLNDRERALLAEGVVRFNRLRFWDAHESWETVWLEADEPEKGFLQGLIQLAAALHHFQRGTPAGGLRLVDAAVEKLSPFAPSYLGIDCADAVRGALEGADRARAQIEQGLEEPLRDFEYPRLRLIEDEHSGIPD